jgi:hypothetical protein
MSIRPNTSDGTAGAYRWKHCGEFQSRSDRITFNSGECVSGQPLISPEASHLKNPERKD